MFSTLWAIDAALGVALLGYFLRGLTTGAVSSFNIVVWLLVFLVVAAVLWSSAALRSAGHPTAATVILASVALPALLAGLLLLAAVLLKPRWN
jgi:hypothetical protein